MESNKKSITKKAEKEEKNMKAEVTKFVNACIKDPMLMGRVQRELLNREATKKVEPKAVVTKEVKRTSVSPAWQAKLEGRITVGQYNAIIAKKMTLEEALSTKVTKEKKVEPKKAIVTKKVEKPKTRAEGIALYYAKQMGIETEDRRLITENDWLDLLEEVETKKGESARKLEVMINRKLEKMIDEKEQKAYLG